MLVSVALWVLGFFWQEFSFMVYFMFPLASAALLGYILHNVLNCSFRMQNVVELQCYIHSHECIQRTLILDNRLVSSRQREMRCLAASPSSELEETLATVLNSG